MRILPWTLVLFSLGAPLSRAEKPCVTISFQVAETRYKGSLGQDGVRTLETDVTTWLLGRLEEDIRFLKPQPAPGCDYQLAFRLDRKDPNREGDLHAIAIHATLSGPGVTDHLGQNHEFWIVRDEDVADRPVGMAGEVLTAIQLRQPPDFAVFLGKPLSQIAITNSGNFVQFDLAGNFKLRGWVIPYEPNELCMPPETALLISNEIRTPVSLELLAFYAKPGSSFNPPAGHHLASLQGRIFCSAEPGDQDFALVDAVGENQVTVKSVHVIEYHSARTLCARPSSIPPTEAGFTGGTP